MDRHANLEGMMARLHGRLGGAHRERFQQIAQRVDQGDESDKYTALTELCEALNMATEETLMAMRADVLVPPTVACLRLEHDNELMYLAARVLTYMADAIPPTASAIIRSDGVPLLCEKPMAITDIELAEQCISCLDRIAGDHPGPVLESGGAVALLSFVDFFSIAVQRNAVSTVAKLCRQVRPRNFELVQSVLPQLRQFVSHDDERMAEHALSALARIANGVKSDANQCVDVFGDTAPILVDVLESEQRGARFTAAVKFLVAVSGVAAVAEMLMELGVVKTIADVLAAGGADASSPNTGGDNGARISGSPIAGPATPPTGAATPPNTPPRLDGQSTPPTMKAKPRVPPDSIAELMSVLRNLLPAPQEDFPLYMDGTELIIADQGRRRSYSSAVVGDDEEDEGDEAEEEDEEAEDDDAEDDDTPPEQRAEQHQSRRSAAHAARQDMERRMLHRLLEARGVQIESDERWTRCRAGRHTCDSCGKTGLQPGDWYRSNEQADSDLCQRCMLVAVGNSETNGSYTDMGALLAEHGAGAAAAGGGAPQPREPKLTDKHALFARSPYLLDRVAEAAGVAIHVALEVDHPAARAAAVEFLFRLAGQATPDVAATLLSVPGFGAFVMQLLRRGTSRLQDVAVGLFVVQRVAAAQPEATRDVCLKDGVLHALSAVRSMGRAGSSKPGSPTTTQQQQQQPAEELHVLAATEAGWRRLLADRASLLVTQMSGGDDRPSVRELNLAAAALDEDSDVALHERWPRALTHLNAGLSLGASAFELFNSGVIDALVRAVAARPTPDDMLADAIALVAGLARSTEQQLQAADLTPSRSGDYTASVTANLVRLVRHCQTVIGQLEAFTSTTNRRSIRLLVTRVRSEGASSPSSPTSPTSPGPMPQPGRRGARESRGRREKTVNVGIEPLATIGAVADFAAQHLYHMGPAGMQRQRSEPQAGPEDDEDVEEVLPELRADGAAAARPAPQAQQAAQSDAAAATTDGAAAPAGPRVYVRYGDQLLPHSMSMQQVMQLYVPRSAHDEPVHLHVSNKPFPEVKESTGAAAHERSFAPRFEPTVAFRAAFEVRAAVSDPLAVEEAASSDSPLPEALVGVLRLLRLIAAVASNPTSTADWFRCVGRARWPELQPAVESIRDVAPLTNIGSELINGKLVNKALRCVNGPACIPVLLDGWAVALATDCPFLFSTPVRRLLFEVAFFGTSRALVRVIEHCKEMEIPVSAHHRNHRVARKKFRVWRDKPLECARAILGAHGTSRSMFDVQYYGEVGSGLGPTHEFFNLAGDAIRSKSLTLWRDGDEDADAAKVDSIQGLFLKPDAAANSASSGTGASASPNTSNAAFAGAFLARGLLDHHVVNLRLSSAMLRLLRGDALVLEDVGAVSPAVYETLLGLLQAHHAKRDTIDVGGATNVPVADLGLAFVLPGRDAIPIMPGGERVEVTPANMAEYAMKVSEALLSGCVHRKTVELREAFNGVITLRGLKLFTPEELSDLFCGHQSVVPAEEWARYTACDHGFTANSASVKLLFDVLGEMSLEQQRGFIRFLTGSPQLPVGGLAALKPRMTVVRKRLGDGSLADEVAQLPSAMTCQNYLKLPAYESKEQLRAKLLQAIEEGAGAFSFT